MSSYFPTEEEKQRFMSRAIELSEKGVSEGHGGPYGSVIVKDGKIVGQLALLAKDCTHLHARKIMFHGGVIKVQSRMSSFHRPTS